MFQAVCMQSLTAGIHGNFCEKTLYSCCSVVSNGKQTVRVSFPLFMPELKVNSKLTPSTPVSSHEPLPSPEMLAATMQSIDQLAMWLENTGLSGGAIAQWKYNCLATTFPALGNLVESAKSLIGTTLSVPEMGMSVTSLATLLSESCEKKIKPADVNQALVELGLQVRIEKERVWELTLSGREYGQTLLATSKTNEWSGTQIKWFKSVIPLLEEYFPSHGGPNEPAENSENKTSLRTQKTKATDKREYWFLEERAKHLGWKTNASQRIHLEMYATDSYKERHGKLPGKQLFKNAQATAYPVADVDLLDAAINKVMTQTNGSVQKQ